MYVDFHSHILPGADHGSESVEMSLMQLRNAELAGVDTIVATPHFYPSDDTVETFLERREKAYEELVAAGIGNIKIIKAAEVQIGIDIEKLPDLPKLCIEGTNFILVEFPPEPWPYWLCDSVKAMARDYGLRPICAHIDRYSHIGRDKIMDMNFDVQINASAFLETRKYRNYYMDLIADDAIHVLGSDVHGDGSEAYKKFSMAIKKIGKYMPAMTENARKILSAKEKRKIGTFL